VTDKVLVEVDDGLMTITINRPEVRNAVDREVSYGVCAAVDELDANPALRVAILTGAGGTFCSGMDLKAFLRGEVTRVVAARDARFGLPEAKRGLAAMAGGLIRLPRLVPQRIALEMALTGEHVDADRMHAYGLINRLVEPGEALAEATAMARQIIANAPLSVQTSKRVITEQRDWSTAESFDRQDEITGGILGSADAQEGARAFAEKRAPVWTGT